MENIKISKELKELFDAYDEKCLESNSQQLIHGQFDIQCILENAVYDMRRNLSDLYSIYLASRDFVNGKLTLEQKASILANDYSGWQCDNIPWHVVDSLVFRQLLSDVICSKCCIIQTLSKSIEFFPEYKESLFQIIK